MRTLADLKGAKVRATGFLRESGGESGRFAGEHAAGRYVEALQKGVSMPPSAGRTLKGWKTGEVIRNIPTACIGYTTSFFVVFNRRFWASLPDEVSRSWKMSARSGGAPRSGVERGG